MPASRLDGVLRIYGSYAGDDVTPSSDIDLMIIGSPDPDELTDRISAAEGELGRPVSYTVLTGAELERRRRSGDRFIASVEADPRVAIVGRMDG